ncbi:MAG: hypothetical protein PHZ09_07890 [Eubacteriales bacterium]|nr:hypothetical protein [Eubacteriales bacterium]
MKTNTKILCALLLAAFVLPLFISCADEAKTADIAQTTAPAQESQTSDSLPEVVYDGAEFTMLARAEDDYKDEFLVDEQVGDIIKDNVYHRNRGVEERFDIKFSPVLLKGHGPDYDNFIATVRGSISAGDDIYNLVGGYTYRLAADSVDGSFINWYKVPYINLDKPWWSDGFLDAAAVGNSSYIVTGDLSHMFLQYTFAVFFNKNLANDFSVPDLYGTVKSGDWTIDLMAEYMKLASADLNGDGKGDIGDRWGFVTDPSTRLDAFLYALEVPISAKDENGIPYIIGPTDKYQSVIEKLNTLMHDSGDTYIDADFMPNMLFAQNLALFSPMRLSEALTLRSMESDFGIIPYPKWDKAQKEYHTYYSDNCTCFVIPKTVSDLDFCGIIVEALAAESYRLVRPAVYEVALKTKYARDNESQDMIDIILDTMLFDFTNIYAFAFGDQQGPAHSLRMNVRAKSNDITSYFAKKEGIYSETLKKLIDAMTAN